MAYKQSHAGDDFALLPLDDAVADLLRERSPAFIKECRQIQARMEQGEARSHEEVLRALEEGP